MGASQVPGGGWRQPFHRGGVGVQGEPHGPRPGSRALAGKQEGLPGWEMPSGAGAPAHLHTRCSEPLFGLAAPDIGSQDDLGNLGLQFLHL